jgi:hypothetical protein
MPFVTDTVSQLVEMIVTEDPVFPDFFSPALRDLLSLMLATEPAKRPAIGDVLAHSWLEAVHKPSTALVREDPERREGAVAALASAFDIPEAECEKQLREGNPDIVVAFRIIMASRVAGVRPPQDVLRSAAAMVSNPNTGAIMHGKAAQHRHAAMDAARIAGMSRSVSRRPYRSTLGNPSFVG